MPIQAPTSSENESSSVQHAARKSTWGHLVTAFVLLFLLPIFTLHRFAICLDSWIFPGLGQLRVRKPLFIIGLPRSGTTFFHRLLATGRDTFTAIPLWELLLAPALCEKYCVGFLYRVDQWLSFGRRHGPAEACIRWLMRFAAHAMDEVHPTELCDAEEDYLALLPYDGCFLRVLVWPYGAWTWQLGRFDEKVSKHRQKKLLTAYRCILQRHLRYRGEHLHLLSKNPGFAAWGNALRQEFPDACFAGLRRDPKQAVPSQLSSIEDGLALFGNSVEEATVVEHFVQLLAYYWTKLEQLQNSLPQDRYCSIEYKTLVQMPAKTVQATLQKLNYSLTPDDQQRLSQMLAEATGFSSRHRYSLEQFKLTPAAIDAAFGFMDSTATSPAQSESDLSTSVPRNWTSHGCSHFSEQPATIARSSGDS